MGDVSEEMANGLSLYDQAREAAEMIAAASPVQPRVGIVLGSGLGSVAQVVEVATVLPFTAIPHMLPTGILGHAGQLVLGTISGVPVAVLQGRVHLYEGYSPQQITFPIRVMRLLGVETLLLTNAAGGVDPALLPGSLLLLRDHIGLPTLVGIHPLFGPNDERFGERFPALNDAYDPILRRLALDAARQRGIPLSEGVYAMVGGPSYETRAETRLLRILGADAVGMSTVPEVIVARHMGMRILAISMITNQALSDDAGADEQAEIPDHEQVLRTAIAASGQLVTLFQDVIGHLA